MSELDWRLDRASSASLDSSEPPTLIKAGMSLTSPRIGTLTRWKQRFTHWVKTRADRHQSRVEVPFEHAVHDLARLLESATIPSVIECSLVEIVSRLSRSREVEWI